MKAERIILKSKGKYEAMRVSKPIQVSRSDKTLTLDDKTFVIIARGIDTLVVEKEKLPPKQTVFEERKKWWEYE